MDLHTRKLRKCAVVVSSLGYGDFGRNYQMIKLLLYIEKKKLAIVFI
jgi:hypothetical protein